MRAMEGGMWKMLRDRCQLEDGAGRVTDGGWQSDDATGRQGVVVGRCHWQTGGGSRKMPLADTGWQSEYVTGRQMVVVGRCHR